MVATKWCEGWLDQVAGQQRFLYTKNTFLYGAPLPCYSDAQGLVGSVKPIYQVFTITRNNTRRTKYASDGTNISLALEKFYFSQEMFRARAADLR